MTRASPQAPRGIPWAEVALELVFLVDKGNFPGLLFREGRLWPNTCFKCLARGCGLHLEGKVCWTGYQQSFLWATELGDPVAP